MITNIEIEIEGGPQGERDRLRIEHAIRAEAHDLIDDAASYAEYQLRGHVPGSYGGEHGIIGPRTSSPGPTTRQRVDRTRVEDAPGQQEATVGIDRRGGDHPLGVDRGTGLFGERGDYIRPVAGNVLVLVLRSGQKIFTRRVKGQEAQHFTQHTYQDVLAWMPVRLELFKAGLRARIRDEGTTTRRFV